MTPDARTRAAVALLVAFAGAGCASASIIVARPVQGTQRQCTALPSDGPPIFAGLESTLPVTEGNLRVVGSSFDDRLTSPGPRALAWGDDGKLLTIERDRAIVWELDTGRAVASVRLPGHIYYVDAITATPDLSRAAALVRDVSNDGQVVPRIVGVHVASGEARLFEIRSTYTEPFLLSNDGTALILGGDVWDAETWTHREAVHVDSGPFGTSLPHPLRNDVATAVVGVGASALLPAVGLRMHTRLLAFGPRLLRYLEPHWDARAEARSAVLGAAPGWVSTVPLDGGAREIRFSVGDPDTIVVVSPNGRFVATLADEFTVRASTSPDVVRRLGGTGWANRALLSDDGRVVILAYEATALTVEEDRAAASITRRTRGVEHTPRLEAWDLDARTMLWRESGALPREARLTPNGHYLWQPRASDVVDLRAGRRLSLGRPIGTVSPRGIALLSDEWGDTTAVNLETGHVVLAPKRRSRILAVSSEGRHFATASPDSGLELEGPGRCTEILPPAPNGREDYIDDSVMFSEDSSTLVAKTYDSFLLHAWDAETGSERYAVTAEAANIELASPLREIRIVAAGRYPTETSHPDVTLLDVRTGARVAAGPGTATPAPYVPELLHRNLATPQVTATRVSPDGALTASANDSGDLTVARAKGGAVVGRAHFAPRHDFVRFLWFGDARHFGAQTARGAVFEFSVEPSSKK